MALFVEAVVGELVGVAAPGALPLRPTTSTNTNPGVVCRVAVSGAGAEGLGGRADGVAGNAEGMAEAAEGLAGNAEGMAGSAKGGWDNPGA